MPNSGLCKTAKTQMDAQERTEWQKSLPEPCRELDYLEGLEGTRMRTAPDGNRHQTAANQTAAKRRVVNGA